ncbi:hypothetical protein N7E81_11095 [Reichenbachiella carrageenanivorans]|uniref:Outer membrane protein beta-barrel domain-containing protein n=1 Tax=Reichenbachiella carrageenanivorans TaxID=2979869 RepID=A0ABY6CVG7_9BACT|nr:hypothetical protein [Reichenbachiella carrageenanivorans]UXX77912.1 hypothetical protein N7E81_11095 [Reichenbachiella carrageenanivorans]
MKNAKSIVVFALLLTVFQSQGQNKYDVQEEHSVKERPFQISLVPGFGTSKGPKEGYINQFSLNIIAGYEYSLAGAEFGGFYNVNQQNIHGAQFAGFGNAVGGDVSGAQFGGFVNTVQGKVHGLQSAGFVNVVNKEVQGTQLSGFINLADSIKGLQAAGAININKRNANAVQLAGLFNYAQDIEGTQVASLVNRAKHVKGTQIALINIADTVEKGVVVGLINVVKTGKHQLAIEHNEVMDINLAFRSGTSKLYSVLFAGIQAQSNFLWSYGAGFGTEFNLKNKWNSSVELTTQSINVKEEHHEELNLLNRLSWNIDYRVAQHLTVSAGPVFNVYVTKVYDPATGVYGDDIGLGTFYDETSSDTNIQMWVGYNFAIKF